MNHTTYINSLLYLLLVNFICIFASDLENHVCYPAINKTDLYYYTNISVPLDTEMVQEIMRKNTSTCVFEFDLRIRGAIVIELTNKDPYRYRICRTFSAIKFKIDKEGLPVKKFDCSDSGKWNVPWPWKKVVVEIDLLFNNTSPYPLTESTVNLKTFVGNFPRLMHQRYKRYGGLIKMPTKLYYGNKIPVYCLGDYYNEISYKRNFLNYYTSTDRERKVKFLLVRRSVCIRTYSAMNSLLDSECHWKVELSIGNEVLMVLKCEGTYDYWCLPEKWIKKSHQLLEIYFVSVDKRSLALDYTIKITTNESFSSYSQYRCPYETTTAIAPTRATKTLNEHEKYWNNRGPSVATYLVPIVAIVVMIFVFICFGSYVKSKRTSRQRRIEHHRLQMAYTPADSSPSVPNPAYRTHDPVMDPTSLDESTPSYYDPPPNYAGVMASAPPTNTAPSSTDIPPPPPPSYEDALAMTNNKNSTHF